eukprot:5923862-Pleurochrysis_carterae.AAC.1
MQAGTGRSAEGVNESRGAQHALLGFFLIARPLSGFAVAKSMAGPNLTPETSTENDAWDQHRVRVRGRRSESGARVREIWEGGGEGVLPLVRSKLARCDSMRTA